MAAFAASGHFGGDASAFARLGAAAGVVRSGVCCVGAEPAPVVGTQAATQAKPASHPLAPRHCVPMLRPNPRAQYRYVSFRSSARKNEPQLRGAAGQVARRASSSCEPP